MFNNVLEKCSTFLVEEVQLHAYHVCVEEVDWVTERPLAVLDVLLICEETDEFCHLSSIIFFVVIDKSTQGISLMYLYRLQSVVAILTNFYLAICNLVIYS